jgi:SAM-dependent methyltransferase
MTQLYSTLAGLYHEMYQHIFDYESEYKFYDTLLKKYHCRKILEIGCGTGMLASRFLDGGYEYLGLDLSGEMLDIARAETKSRCFIQGDMRNLSFDEEFDAVLITGRSIAYVTENKGILDTLAGINKSMKGMGLLVFGVFEANAIFDHLSDFEQTIEHNKKKIRRISQMKKNMESGWTYDWHAKYIIEQEGRRSEFNDVTTLRAFLKDEILLFLKLAGFEIKDIIAEEKALTLIAIKRNKV